VRVRHESVSPSAPFYERRLPCNLCLLGDSENAVAAVAKGENPVDKGKSEEKKVVNQATNAAAGGTTPAAAAPKQFVFVLTGPKLLVGGLIAAVGIIYAGIEIKEKIVDEATSIATRIAREAAETAAANTATALADKLVNQLADDAKNKHADIASIASDMRKLKDSVTDLKPTKIAADSQGRLGIPRTNHFPSPSVCMLSRVTAAGTEGETCALSKDDSGWTLSASPYGNGYSVCEAICIGPGNT
jgi:hypothetical protein